MRQKMGWTTLHLLFILMTGTQLALVEIAVAMEKQGPPIQNTCSYSHKVNWLGWQKFQENTQYSMHWDSFGKTDSSKIKTIVISIVAAHSQSTATLSNGSWLFQPIQQQHTDFLHKKRLCINKEKSGWQPTTKTMARVLMLLTPSSS
jgi:hypothetical protein